MTTIICDASLCLFDFDKICTATTDAEMWSAMIDVPADQMREYHRKARPRTFTAEQFRALFTNDAKVSFRKGNFFYFEVEIVVAETSFQIIYNYDEKGAAHLTSDTCMSDYEPHSSVVISDPDEIVLKAFDM